MNEIIVSVLLLAGASFMVLAAVGVLRLPDLPTRMHATTKAGAMGAMLTMAGVAFHFGDGVFQCGRIHILKNSVVIAIGRDNAQPIARDGCHPQVARSLQTKRHSVASLAV